MSQKIAHVVAEVIMEELAKKGIHNQGVFYDCNVAVGATINKLVKEIRQTIQAVEK